MEEEADHVGRERATVSGAHGFCGMVSRRSGACYLQVVSDRTSATLQSIIREHVGAGATIISDEYPSYQYLQDEYAYWSVAKWKSHGHSYPYTYTGQTILGDKIEVHTNTIEGLWSELDSHIHASRGCGATFMWAILAEFMYHKLRVPFLAALQQ